MGVLPEEQQLERNPQTVPVVWCDIDEKSAEQRVAERERVIELHTRPRVVELVRRMAKGVWTAAFGGGW